MRYLPASLLPLLFGLALTTSCSRQEPVRATPPPEPPPPPAEHVPPPEDEPAPITESATTRILAGVGFETPEAVVHDSQQDVYFVSNIHGSPLDKDNNGFISKVTPDGDVDVHFIQGGQGKVTLHAPKGMTIVDRTLVVADIDVVRLFDRYTGAPQGTVSVEGATFLNDVALGPDRKTIYISDSGLTADQKPSGTDAVYRLVNGKVSPLARGEELGHPNGLFPEEGGTWVVTFGSGELYWVSNAGKREKVQKLPHGGLDGIVKGADGRFLISSWEASSVLAGEPSQPFTVLLSGVDAPAAIGYDLKRNRLLVPLFKKHALVLHTLDASGPPH